MADSDSILLFDGDCNLCNRVVNFVILKDKDKKIRFASLQSTAAQLLLKGYNLHSGFADSVIFLSEGRAFIRSSAVLHLLKNMGGGWRVLYVFIIVPSFIRNFFYDLIAKNRYRFFGMRDNCMVPSEETKERFLTANHIE
jgi:predicted DCC family thiol-disulfide oxidoreductase YuxK